MSFEVKIPKQKGVDPALFIQSLKLDEICRATAVSSVTRIKQATTSGRQASGAPLKRYSDSYAALKLAATGSSLTNLTVTQELLRSMVVNTFQDGQKIGARITFQGSHAPGNKLFKKDFSSKRPKRTKRGKQIISARKARIVSRKGVKITSKKKAAGQGPSRGGSLTNAALAESLMDKGFVGWFEFSATDKAQARRAVNEAILKAGGRVFTTK